MLLAADNPSYKTLSSNEKENVLTLLGAVELPPVAIWVLRVDTKPDVAVSQYKSKLDTLALVSATIKDLEKKEVKAGGTEQVLLYSEEIVNVTANNTLVKARKA